jgi:pilus assembly protein CpaC
MTRILSIALAGALMTSLAPVETLAQASSSIDTTVGSQQLTLGVGKSAVIELPRDAAEIFVANPEIANAIVRTPRRIFVIGQSNGQTSIYAIDKEGRRFLALDLRVGRDIAELRQILRASMPKASLDVRTVNDTIILMGEVDSAAEAQKAYDIADAFVGYTSVGAGSAGAGGASISFGGSSIVRGKLINSLVIRGRDQVMVKVSVAEVRRSIIKQFGIDSDGSWSQGSISSSNPMMNMFGHIDPVALTGKLTGAGGSISGTLSMLERNGVARVLAEPTVMATSGETAKFLAGGETQVAVSSDYQSAVRDGTTGIVTTPGKCMVSYQLRKYGVQLTMTPVVLSEGRIQLRIATEVTEVDPSGGGVRGACGGLPGMRTRVNETTLELPSGGSAVSAGLIQQRSMQIFNGQPGLMSLPILGTLFRSREFQREDTELMIIMTPYIAKPTAPDKLARPDDGFVEPSDGQAIFLGRMNRLYSTPSNPQNLRNLKGRVGFIND